MFQLDRYRRYPWLHYSVQKKLLHFVSTAVNISKHMIYLNELNLPSLWQVVTTEKRTLQSKKGFIKHQSSGLHKKGKDKFHPEIPNQDLSEMMSSNLKNDRKNNQAMLLKILPSIQFLGKYLVPYLQWYCNGSSMVPLNDYAKNET